MLEYVFISKTDIEDRFNVRIKGRLPSTHTPYDKEYKMRAKSEIPQIIANALEGLF